MELVAWMDYMTQDSYSFIDFNDFQALHFDFQGPNQVVVLHEYILLHCHGYYLKYSAYIHTINCNYFVNSSCLLHLSHNITLSLRHLLVNRYKYLYLALNLTDYYCIFNTVNLFHARFYTESTAFLGPQRAKESSWSRPFSPSGNTNMQGFQNKPSPVACVGCKQ